MTGLFKFLAQFINSLLTVFLTVSLGFSSFFISSGSLAEKEMTRTEFINLNVKKINGAKSVDEYVDSLTTISTDTRDEIKAWAKSKGVIKVPNAVAHDPDIIIQADGKKAKLTIVDFKRRIIQINDKSFELNEKQSVAQNFDRIAKLLDNQKSLTISLFPNAEANPLIWGLVVVVIGGALYYFAKTSDNRIEALDKVAKADGAKQIKIVCEMGDGVGDHSQREVKIRKSGSDEITTIRYTPNDSDPNDLKNGVVEVFNGAELGTKSDKDLKLIQATISCCRTHPCRETYEKASELKPLTDDDGDPPQTSGERAN